MLAEGVPEHNLEFVKSMDRLDRILGHPLEREGEGSSEDEYSCHEDDVYDERSFRVSREEGRRRINARRAREQEEAEKREKEKQEKEKGKEVPKERVSAVGKAKGKGRTASTLAQRIVVKPAAEATADRPARTLKPVPPPPNLSPRIASTSTETFLPRTRRETSKRGRPESPVAKLSSEDDDVEIIQPPPPKKANRSAAVAATSTSKAKVSEPASKKSKKPVPTLEAIVDEVTKKMKPLDLRKQFPSISRLIDYYNEFEPHNKNLFLAGCRVCFVNPNPRSPTSKEINWVDDLLALRMGRAACAGATLVKPEEFVAAPSEARPTPKWKKVALEKGWTTQILPYKRLLTPEPDFEEVLTCLGPNGLTAEGLGPYVHVVEGKWLTDSLTSRSGPVSELACRYPGQPDLMAEKEEQRAGQAGEQQATGAAYRGPASSDGEIQVEGDRRDSRSAEDLSDERSVSPFESQDFPAGERPAVPSAGKGDRKERATVNEEDEAATSEQHGFEGLEEELDEIARDGLQAVDEMLDADEGLSREDRDKDGTTKTTYDSDFIFTSRDAGADTDDEASDEKAALDGAGGGRAWEKRSGKVRYASRDGPGWACDRGSSGRAEAPSPNERTAKTLEQIADIKQGQWQVRGYSRAASALRNCPHLVDTREKALKIDGIGESIADKIVEIVRTGTHRQVSQATTRQRAVATLSGIYGIGKKLAEEYFEAGVRSLDDLRKEPERWRLTSSQLLGLEYFDDLQVRIPRLEVEELHQHAVEVGKEIDQKLQVHCMGSYRRGAADCGDIDLLVTRDTSDGRDHRGMVKRLWEGLVARGVGRHALSVPDEWDATDAKVNALCAVEGGKMRRMDILGVPWDEMPAALIYFTGNDHFNRSMRLKARKLGYRLNQRALYKDVARDPKTGLKLTEGVRVPCRTEKDIFDKLGVPYRPPTERIP